MGTSPWRPSPQTERWKQVCLCGNAAVMLLDTQQAAVTLLGRLPQRPSLDTTKMEQLVMEKIGTMLAMQAAFSQMKKRKQTTCVKQEKSIES